mmetsp:Transcript_101813/g.286045  ORF Transcript_101813/g.286045 Transcript_101813/m.286045 type:complete len:242 (-) Transcript_101813:390-1115(-)
MPRSSRMEARMLHKEALISFANSTLPSTSMPVSPSSCIAVTCRCWRSSSGIDLTKSCCARTTCRTLGPGKGSRVVQTVVGRIRLVVEYAGTVIDAGGLERHIAMPTAGSPATSASHVWPSMHVVCLSSDTMRKSMSSDSIEKSSSSCSSIGSPLPELSTTISTTAKCCHALWKYVRCTATAFGHRNTCSTMPLSTSSAVPITGLRGRTPKGAGTRARRECSPRPLNKPETKSHLLPNCVPM